MKQQKKYGGERESEREREREREGEGEREGGEKDAIISVTVAN
jgi:hypothetical protein